jgi:hypothetical protein
MKLFIIESVLIDYNPGMVVIAAENLEDCRSIFKNQFAPDYVENPNYTPEKYDHFFMIMKDYDNAIQNQNYTILDVLNVESGIISYAYGTP